jgi:hypothetical protein
MILTTVVTGVIARDVPVSLTNIGRGGCLLDSTLSLPVGTTGTLCVEILGTVYSDGVRVTRSSRVLGAGERHHIGVEFLQLDVPGARSLRRYASALTTPYPEHGQASGLRFESD